MAITKLNSLAIPPNTIVESDLSYPLTNFSSTGIDDNASSTAVTIDGSQNVGINNASPSELLSIIGTGGTAKIRFDGDSSNLQNNFIGITGYDDLIIASDESNSGTASTIQFRVDAAERMRIDSSGYLRINNTDGGNYLVKVTYNGGSQEGIGLQSSYSGFGNMIRFLNSAGGTVGLISTNNTTTTYGTSSDYRLKENVVDLDNATDRLKQIPVYRFNFIANPETTVDGFLAHEVADVVPEAIVGTKDEVDDEGNPVYQNIDQSKLVPLLTAALQEALTRIESLETRLSALEAN